ncbi:MAG: ABC transporter permease [Bacteroidetes bacterium]|nr:ABC transporter permease [Bacteroidota bacterium]
MIKNYFDITVRNILKNKLFSILYILGLALGMATTILILLWVSDELSYDRYNANHKNIFRVINHYSSNGTKKSLAITTASMGETMCMEYPEIESSCRLKKSSNQSIEYDNVIISESDMGYADSTFFEMFTVPLIYGNDKNILDKPYQVALSESTATKHFSSENPIGKSIGIGGSSFIISGVYRDIPNNSHFKFNAIMSMETLSRSRTVNWDQQEYYTFITVKSGTNLRLLHSKIQGLIEKYYWPIKQHSYKGTFEEYINEGTSFELQPITDIHLKSDLLFEISPNNDIIYIYIFSFIGLFILLIACINFMNMSTAKSETRSKEVGIRKVSGAVKKQIIFQYLFESFLIVFISCLLAIVLIEIVLPYFNRFSGKEISVEYFNLSNLISLCCVVIITSIIAGSYPSFHLSSIKPIQALKGRFRQSKSGMNFRNILVVIQLITTIVLISCSLILYHQLNFIHNKKLGFTKENLICLHNSGLLGDQAQLFKKELLNHPEFLTGTISSFLPVQTEEMRAGVMLDGDDKNMHNMPHWTVDFDYIKTLELNITEGRAFSPDFGTDSTAVIFNEAAIKQFGWDDPLNHFIKCTVFRNGGWQLEKLMIIGVVQDFHYESLQKDIAPMLMYINSRNGNIMTFRYQSDDIKKVTALLESKWKEFLPNQPFSYSFLEDRFDNMYYEEQQIGKIMVASTILAIIIASLGLFGLSAFLAEKRIKEIGIRKINGASSKNIFILFSTKIIKLTLISFVIAIPLCWYFMDNWLNNFAYRTNIQWSIFLLSGLIAFVIAILTVSYQGYRASVRNPIDTLKYE